MLNEFRDELTPEQVKAIVAEIDEQHKNYDQPKNWRVVSIEQFYRLSDECYGVMYENGVHSLFVREEDGQLRPTGVTTYYASFDFKRPSKPTE